MKLYTFDVGGEHRLGVEHNGQLVDLNVASGGSPLLSDLRTFVTSGALASDAARKATTRAVESPTGPNGQRLIYSFEEVRLRAPLPHPGKILCSGINYHSHLEENPAAKLPAEPFFFAKLPNTVIGPSDPIIYPKMTQQLDYEVEFAVVIGRRMQRTLESEVMGCIAGYTILHDVSARDVQFKDNQITLGKNFDTFAPIGPCMVTSDEIPDPSNVRLRAFVNGELRQDSSTREWVFPLPKLLAFLSRVMTLEPGDIVSTGTPAGVGAFRKPTAFLNVGDRVRLEIDGIGHLENPVIAHE